MWSSWRVEWKCWKMRRPEQWKRLRTRRTRLSKWGRFSKQTIANSAKNLKKKTTNVASRFQRKMRPSKECSASSIMCVYAQTKPTEALSMLAMITGCRKYKPSSACRITAQLSCRVHKGSENVYSRVNSGALSSARTSSIRRNTKHGRSRTTRQAPSK